MFAQPRNHESRQSLVRSTATPTSPPTCSAGLVSQRRPLAQKRQKLSDMGLGMSGQSLHVCVEGGAGWGRGVGEWVGPRAAGGGHGPPLYCLQAAAAAACGEGGGDGGGTSASASAEQWQQRRPALSRSPEVVVRVKGVTPICILVHINPTHLSPRAAAAAAGRRADAPGSVSPLRVVSQVRLVFGCTCSRGVVGTARCASRPHSSPTRRSRATEAAVRYAGATRCSPCPPTPVASTRAKALKCSTMGSPHSAST